MEVPGTSSINWGTFFPHLILTLLIGVGSSYISTLIFANNLALRLTNAEANIKVLQDNAVQRDEFRASQVQMQNLVSRQEFDVTNRAITQRLQEMYDTQKEIRDFLYKRR